MYRNTEWDQRRYLNDKLLSWARFASMLIVELYFVTAVFGGALASAFALSFAWALDFDPLGAKLMGVVFNSSVESIWFRFVYFFLFIATTSTLIILIGNGSNSSRIVKLVLLALLVAFMGSTLATLYTEKTLIMTVYSISSSILAWKMVRTRAYSTR